MQLPGRKMSTGPSCTHGASRRIPRRTPSLPRVDVVDRTTPDPIGADDGDQNQETADGIAVAHHTEGNDSLVAVSVDNSMVCIAQEVAIAATNNSIDGILDKLLHDSPHVQIDISESSRDCIVESLDHLSDALVEVSHVHFKLYQGAGLLTPNHDVARAQAVIVPSAIRIPRHVPGIAISARCILENVTLEPRPCQQVALQVDEPVGCLASLAATICCSIRLCQAFTNERAGLQLSFSVVLQSPICCIIGLVSADDVLRTCQAIRNLSTSIGSHHGVHQIQDSWQSPRLKRRLVCHCVIFAPCRRDECYLHAAMATRDGLVCRIVPQGLLREDEGVDGVVPEHGSECHDLLIAADR
mmetsp:Transcript_53445/g.115515  ORF Transcript_53445/g.115515 Transcript_53445/m.115515 type:complete len:356 (+) Transcript_53445:113-1180(+)